MEQVFYYFFQLFDLLLPLLPRLFPIVFLVFLYFLGKYYTLKHITYERHFSYNGVFEGEDIELIEEVTNHSFLPVFHIDIESLIPADLHFYGLASQDNFTVRSFISRFTLLPFTTVRRTHRARCLKRGTFQLETAQIIFFRKVFVLPSKTTLCVYPRQLTFTQAHHLDCYLSSMEPSRVPLFADAFSFSGVREYMPGDSLHSINHKASARFGQNLYVNRQEFITGRRQMLYQNFETTSEFSTEDYRQYMEVALSYCVYLLSQACSAGFETGFAANCRLFHGEKFLRYPVGAGQHSGQYEEILHAMADVTISRGQSIASLLSMDIANQLTNTEILLFTLTMDERCEEALRRLELLGNQVHVIWLDKI